MQPKIENVGRREVEIGHHQLYGDDTLLISITDPCGSVPKLHHSFRHVVQFEFLDIEDANHEFACTHEQATEIVELLELCMISRYNVLVHCNAGICRSGAVAEIGEMLGFQYVGSHKQPNLHVKRLMMNILGWGYHDQTS